MNISFQPNQVSALRKRMHNCDINHTLHTDTQQHADSVETETGITFKMLEYCLNIALRPQAPKHFRGGRSHYPDTSEPVVGYGTNNTVTDQSGTKTSNLSLITGPPHSKLHWLMHDYNFAIQLLAGHTCHCITTTLNCTLMHDYHLTINDYSRWQLAFKLTCIFYQPEVKCSTVTIT
jgi:hypothetical protein